MNIGGLVSGAMGLFGHHNDPSKDANKYISQIPGQTAPHYQPWEQAGISQIPGLEQQYGQLLNNPGEKYNEIGKNFQQSPGFQFALQQALQGANNAAAAGGMAGSPEHELQNMTLGTNLANQNYYNYMGGATGLYGKGLTGSQEMANQGQMAGQNYAEQIANTLAQQGNLAYAGTQARNETKNRAFGDLASGIFF
jgi:hypothetical protein